MNTRDEAIREQKEEEAKLLQLLEDAAEPQSVYDLQDEVGFDEGGVFGIAAPADREGKTRLFPVLCGYLAALLLARGHELLGE